MSKDDVILNANNLKDALWTTLQDLRNGKVDVNEAAATAALGHVILKTVKLQLETSSHISPPKSVSDFTNDSPRLIKQR